MKTLILFVCLFPCVGFAADRSQLNVLLARTTNAQGKEYLDARKAVLDLGKEGQKLLAQAGGDQSLTWQQRLAARICYENMLRAEEIEALRKYNWRADPKYDRGWEGNIMGPVAGLGEIVIPKCIKAGLWYYYIELTWKRTKEFSFFGAPRMAESWPGWCREALGRQPEERYLVQAIGERLEEDSAFQDYTDVWLYQGLIGIQEADVIPALIRTHYAYFARLTSAAPEQQPEIYRNNFAGLMEFADARHADLIEKFIAGHPALAPLKGKVAEIRKRPAPVPPVEPLFRLGAKLVNP